MVNIILPPAAAIEAASADLDRAATDAGQVKRAIAISKATYDLLMRQPQICRVSGAYLVPSTSQAGLVYRVSDVNGCSCPAGSKGNICRHAIAIELIELANTRTMPALGDRISAARRAHTAAEAAKISAELFG